ncbi:UNVERIFIED_CONTAM: hypothetical protein Sangu_2838600 [Sesamum angustifolium]|uniref:Uncharacterized protein n=1 Tax=Sesamum angustifolium TaxID=2727405 RepID=A0AAW2IQ95_9LAMI
MFVSMCPCVIYVVECSLSGIEMNGIGQNDKNRNFKKTYPGCLGRMVNLFELNVGVSTNRLLADKPHQDGAHFFYSICSIFCHFPLTSSLLSRSRSDVSRMSSSGDQIEEKVTAPEFKSSFPNRKSNGTPMKMLIAQEMSKEVVSQPDPPNLVAKLMGLDALPHQEAESTTQRSHSRGRPRSHSDIPMSCWEQQKGFFHHGYEETINDNKMALVRQKFVEAKRLSMDEKLRKSKQFQDALEVLNSNKDLFLKCLQEPNSIFSQQLYSQQSVSPPPGTKRITVLRPTKVADINIAGAGNKDGNQMKKGAFLQLNGLEKIHPGSSPPASYQSYENPTQPTRIVVLKPSPGKPHDINAVSSPHSEPPKRLQGGDSFGNEGEDENQESREIARAITQQMREKLGRHLRDETLTSSVFSNGYAGDESSFNKSEIEYADGNLSDSEIMSPVSRHSWDYVNKLCSPYSSSSFSRASYSPESSVCREAKKRLSERWAMMASNRSYQEQGMFAEAPAHWVKCLLFLRQRSEQRTDENVDSSPRNLTRSKSVPISSTEFGTRLNIGVSVSDNGKPEVPKEDAKASTVKSLVQRESFKTGLAMENPCESGNQGEQPSPISVLDEHFEEDERKAKVFPHYAKPDQQGVKLPLDSTGSNLIDKSPPIGSIARTLSWDDSCIDTASSHPAKECLATEETDEDEQELYTFVETLLLAAGLQGEVQSDSFLARWHSPQSPLDPLLRDKYIDLKDKETLHEAERRQRRSMRKLVFDCVNTALVDISGYGSDLGQRAIPCIGANNQSLDSASLTMVDKVWGRMNVWFSSKVKCVSDDSGDEHNLVVERLIRNEVAGKGWMDHLRLEIDDLGMEIEARLLEELLQESVVELTGRV